MHGLRCDVKVEDGLCAATSPQQFKSTKKEEDVTFPWSLTRARSACLLVLLFSSIPWPFLLCFTIPTRTRRAMFPLAFQQA